MYQPYPGATQMPDTAPRTVPQSVRQAVRAMYGGAAVSLIYLIASIATVGSTEDRHREALPAPDRQPGHHRAACPAHRPHRLGPERHRGVAPHRPGLPGREELGPDHRHGAVRHRHPGCLRGAGQSRGGPGQDPRLRDLGVLRDRGYPAVAGRLHRLLQGPPAMIEVCGLTRRFGPVTAVDGLSFTARPGRVTGFLGPNGAGNRVTELRRSSPRAFSGSTGKSGVVSYPGPGPSASRRS